MNDAFKKILDFALLFAVVFLIFSFFMKDDTTQVQNTGILFSASENTYKIPAGVVLTVENNTPDTVSFNSCEDIQIRYLGAVSDIESTPCEDLTVESGSVARIDYGDNYQDFIKTGSYGFDLTVDGKQFSTSIEIKNQGFFGKLFSGVFYAPIFNAVVFFITLFSGSLGWAIVSITILIRVILLWPQHKMMVSQKKMQGIQPKVKEIQNKHKGNQQAIGMELMNLYKKEGVNPLGSCGFLIIQMPLLLVIYHVILSIQDSANFYYLYNFMPLATVSDIKYIFFNVDLLSSGGLAGVIAGLVVGAIQFVQIKLSIANNKAKKTTGVVLEKKKGEKDYSSMMPDPEMMNKVLLYGMPTMIAIFTYNFFLGIGLYWGVSTLFAIGQQLFVNKKLKK